MAFKIPSAPPVMIQHIEVNEKVGRISIDGEVNGKLAAVVILESEVPSRAKRSEGTFWKYLEERLRQSAEASAAGA
jgi:hypothetical protein